MTPYDILLQESRRVNGTHPIPHGQHVQDAEVYMKDLINDWDKMTEMWFESVNLRLNKPSGDATNRTFLLSLRDVNGGYKGTRELHRFNQHGQLMTVGTYYRTRDELTGISQPFYDFLLEPRPYGYKKPVPELKKRAEERVKLTDTQSQFHPMERPYDKQARLTYSHTNKYQKSLIKREVLDNATAFRCTPLAKKRVKFHYTDGASYAGRVLRFVTYTVEDGTTIHYFKCSLKSGQNNNKFDVHLGTTVLKNWSPKKHLPVVKAYLGIE